MVKLRISDVYAGNPNAAAPAMTALNDMLRQRMGRDLGRLLRRIERSIMQQADEASKEHQRIIELYSPKDADGKPVPPKSENDLTDKAAFQADYDTLIGDTFEVDGIPEGMLAGMSLMGATWASPLIIEEAPPKKEAAPSPGDE